MSEKLSFHWQGEQIDISGKIDEDANFETLIKNPALTKASKILFNFAKIDLINSCGIREWIKFLAKIPATVHISYDNCPQIIIEQINMVQGFIRPGSTIVSFYAPYYCEKCDHEFKIRLESKDIMGQKAPIRACSQCQSTMEFDAIEEQYFQFLKR